MKNLKLKSLLALAVMAMPIIQAGAQVKTDSTQSTPSLAGSPQAMRSGVLLRGAGESGHGESLLSLDSCLSLARRNNKELRRAELNIDKAQQVKNQAFTNYFPQVKATAMGYHSLHPMVEVGIEDVGNASVRDLLTTLYGNYGAALGLGNTLSFFQYGYQAGVTALQPVYMGGKIVAGNRLAQVGVDAAKLQTQITERDLLEQVEESYWLVVGLTEKQNTLQTYTALLDTVHRTVQVAVNAGLALQTDLLQVELRQSEIQRTQIQLDNGLSLAKRALWQSLGKTYPVQIGDGLDGVKFETIQADSALQAPPLKVEEGKSIESSLLSLQVRAVELQRRMDIADALPQVAVGAHYGYSNMQANFLRDGLGSKTGNGAVFVTVSVPLTDWWETGHKIREDNIAVEQARLEEQNTNELLSLRTQQAYDNMVEAYSLVSENRHAVDIARENYRLSGVNYRAGMGTITDLLTAQASLLQAENDLTDAIIAYKVNMRRYMDLTK